MKILIVNPFGIGDVLFTTPLISNLKEAFPDSYIGYVCNVRTKDVLLSNPNIDITFIYEKDKFRKLWKVSKILCIKKVLRLLKSIKKKRFDVVFDLSLAQEYGFFLWLIGIKKRIGYSYKNRGIFLTDKVNINGYDKKHIADYYVELLRFMGMQKKQKNLKFPISESELAWARSYMAKQGVTDQDLVIGLVPGGGASWGADAHRKQWPPHRFAGLANEIRERFNARIVLFGDCIETPLCNQVASLIKSDPVMACGNITISRFAALLGRCTLVVCNDGGPLHIAVSQGVRTISIFGPVDPLVYGPYPGDGQHIVVEKSMGCRPCYVKFKLKECRHADCLSSIEVGEIMGGINKFLSGELGGA